VPSPKSQRLATGSPARVPGIHVCNLVVGGKTPILPRERLAQMGFAGILYANAALQAAVKAMQTVLGHLNRTGSISGIEASLASFDERQQVVRYDVFTGLERRYRED